MLHRITATQMIHLDFLKLVGGFAASIFGGIAVYLAQFTPKEAEGWMQLGGLAISLCGAVVAIRYLVKKNEEKDEVIVGLFTSVEQRQKEVEAKREADRDRIEQKFDILRQDDLGQREADRDVREKFTAAIDRLADAVEQRGLNQSGIDSKR